jgi:hypothetical protein
MVLIDGVASFVAGAGRDMKPEVQIGEWIAEAEAALGPAATEERLMRYVARHHSAALDAISRWDKPFRERVFQRGLEAVAKELLASGAITRATPEEDVRRLMWQAFERRMAEFDRWLAATRPPR